MKTSKNRGARMSRNGRNNDPWRRSRWMLWILSRIYTRFSHVRLSLCAQRMQYGPQDEDEAEKEAYHASDGRTSSLRDHVMNGGRLFSKLFSYVASNCARRSVSRCSTKIMLGDERRVQAPYFGRGYLKEHFFVIVSPLTDNFAPHCWIITV